MTQRDRFWTTWTALAEEDERLVLVTADMSAPALDEFRTRHPHRYINVGIAEQNMILVAAGLAQEGFLPAVYAIQPFVALRCYEQWKAVVCLMQLPVLGIGVGAGVSYQDSGPTHHAIEDLAIMRILPHMTVWNCSSNGRAAQAARNSVARQDDGYPSYVRLDRLGDDNTTADIPSRRVLPRQGYDIHLFGPETTYKPDKAIVTTGTLTYPLLRTAAKTCCTVIEVCRYPVGALAYDIGALFAPDARFLVVEENNDRGGLCAEFTEAVCGLPVSVTHWGLNVSPGYGYHYGRDRILTESRLTTEAIESWIESP